jgi:hypothetical protein
MSPHTKRLIRFWGKARDVGVHPEDAALIKAHNFKAKAERKLHVDQFTPVPWVGNLTTAKVIIVMLNPGMQKLYKQLRDEKLERPHLVRNLRQKNQPTLFCLHPELKETGGGRYWRGRFRTYVESQFDNLDEGYVHLSRHICIIQLVPYHSQKDPGGVRTKLPSAKAMRDWILAELKLKRRKIIVIRGYNDIWPNDTPANHPKLLICKGKLSLRRPSFNPTGRISKQLAMILGKAFKD